MSERSGWRTLGRIVLIAAAAWLTLLLAFGAGVLIWSVVYKLWLS